MKNNEPKKIIKKALRLNIVIAVAIVLSVNSFAWFVYSSRVSNSITTKVKAWRINFESGENQVAEYINFSIDSLYPGMVEYNNTINIVNYGETSATLNFEIDSIRILDVVYDMQNYTLEELLLSLKDDYPFSIEFTVSNWELAAEDGVSDFGIKVTWPFESGDDVADTYWGDKSFEWQQENPEESGIAILIKLSAIQNN